MEDKSEWWATPTVIGLMGFGLTTMMAGLSNLPAPWVNGFGGGSAGGTPGWTVFGMAIIFGGIIQILAGIIGLRKGNLFAGSAFCGYGAFWIAYTFMLFGFINVAPGAPVLWYGVAAFSFMWMMFTLSFLINSMKHGWGIFFVFLFLFLAFVLLVVKFWQMGAADSISKGENWAIGSEIVLTGATAWYVATANLTNWNYGRKALPV